LVYTRRAWFLGSAMRGYSSSSQVVFCLSQVTITVDINNIMTTQALHGLSMEGERFPYLRSLLVLQRRPVANLSAHLLMWLRGHLACTVDMPKTRNNKEALARHDQSSLLVPS